MNGRKTIKNLNFAKPSIPDIHELYTLESLSIVASDKKVNFHFWLTETNIFTGADSKSAVNRIIIQFSSFKKHQRHLAF